jgi:hypothetical protein
MTGEPDDVDAMVIVEVPLADAVPLRPAHP